MIFTANAAWLVLARIAFNLSRFIGTPAGPELGKARGGSIRRELIRDDRAYLPSRAARRDVEYHR